MYENQTPTTKGFINFSAYIEVLPIVIATQQLLAEYANKEKAKEFIFIFT